MIVINNEFRGLLAKTCVDELYFASKTHYASKKLFVHKTMQEGRRSSQLGQKKTYSEGASKRNFKHRLRYVSRYSFHSNPERSIISLYSSSKVLSR